MKSITLTRVVLIFSTFFALAISSCSQSDITNEGLLSFQNSLKIPPLLEPTIDLNGNKHYELTMQTGTTEFLPGKPAETWGVNGNYLGPTIRASRGDQVSFTVKNQLNEPSTLHWHGMRLPAVMDGGPHQMIDSGASWTPFWMIDQPAATTWYHPHLHGKTAKHVYQGLAGLFLIDDPDSKKLPSKYGIDDIPLIIQDKQFKEDGSFTMDTNSAFGLLGNHILVNGTHDPFLEIESKQIRFRLLNASNARTFHFGFTDGRSFHIVGNDAGLLPKVVTENRISLSPGERAEIVVDFKPGDQTTLHSYKGSNGVDNGEFDLLKIVAGKELSNGSLLPEQLTTVAPIDAPLDAKVRQFILTGASRINGKEMDMYRIDEVVPAESREIWEIKNTGWAHNFHIHEAAFRIIEMNGQPAPAYISGRKDTVFLPSGTTVRLAVEFGQYEDPFHAYMFHCHILLHEDEGMMGQFVIVKPGTEATVTKRLPIANTGEVHSGKH
ncbi:multicopper oxidase family protein [Paenibacillus silviterrae]|uniref:multicopper oxidase family protein n=1 Tax=Paenibacillus silviterrae TaxID=3242194 RepID=UPI0025437829|nr:multicopper oxidase domain-containing protein [Paenibacillus chinjuensis]